jgi:biotin carboxyl carrier protein
MITNKCEDQQTGMNKIAIIALSAILMMSCGGKAQQDDEQEQPHVTDVSVIHVAYGHIDKQIELAAVTAFLKKNVVTAPVASFITACYVQPGSIVHRGQILYRMESKEREALGGDVIAKNMGINYIKATTAGVVTEVFQQTGGYVTEGSTLCSVANTNSMVFEVNVPTEDMRYARPGTNCLISLPDGREFSSVLSTPLATMDINAQVQQIPAHAKTSFLSEGLRAKALLPVSSSRHHTQLLPKSAIQSDDNMTSFWIMEVSDSGTAKKIPVVIGNSNNAETEILSPRISSTDRIITIGSYQLQDGDKVKIVK